MTLVVITILASISTNHIAIIIIPSRTNINTIQIISTKLVTTRARASRAYHTGAGVWGHNPAVGGNAAEEVSPSSPFCHL